MNDGRCAVGCVIAEWTAALSRRIELIGLFEVAEIVRIIHSVVEAGSPQRVPGIDTEGATISGAVPVHQALATLIADDGPTRRRRPIAKADSLDLDRREAGPGIRIVGVTDGLSRHAELAAKGEDRGVADLPDKAVRRID